jgi:hypothetical protein
VKGLINPQKNGRSALGLFQLWVVVPAAFLDIFLAFVFPSSVLSTRRSMGKVANYRRTNFLPRIMEKRLLRAGQPSLGEQSTLDEDCSL